MVYQGDVPGCDEATYSAQAGYYRADVEAACLRECGVRLGVLLLLYIERIPKAKCCFYQGVYDFVQRLRVATSVMSRGRGVEYHSSNYFKRGR